MIGLLIFIQMFDVVGCYVTCPLHIEVRVRSLHHGESRVLARVDHCIVDVCRVGYLERHEQVFDLLSVVDPDPV